MNAVLGWIGGILIILSILEIILDWVILLMIKIMCFKRVECISDTCPFRDFCSKKIISPRELEELRQMLAEYDRVHGICRK